MLRHKKKTFLHLHKHNRHVKGEGIGEILHGVKKFANAMHTKITRPYLKKEGSKNLKEIADIAKKREEDTWKKYENTSVARRRPEKFKQLLQQQENFRNKIRNQNFSYKDI